MRALLLVALTLSLAACAPRLAPPYRDFRVAALDTSVDVLVRQAATEAGWVLDVSPDDAVVTTVPRLLGGTLTRTTALLEIVPMSGDVVRVWVRGEARGWFGGRTKLYALSPTVRERALAPLTAALAARGLRALDAPAERDEDATDG